MSLLERAIEKAQEVLLSQQTQDGYWWATLESNVTMTAEAILLHKLYGTDVDRPMQKALNYLHNYQCKNGSWELYKGDGGNLSVSIEAYMGLRLLGVAIDQPGRILAVAAPVVEHVAERVPGLKRRPDLQRGPLPGSAVLALAGKALFDSGSVWTL